MNPIPDVESLQTHEARARDALRHFLSKWRHECRLTSSEFLLFLSEAFVHYNSYLVYAERKAMETARVAQSVPTADRPTVPGNRPVPRG